MYLTSWEEIGLEISIQLQFLFEVNQLVLQHSHSLSVQKDKIKQIKANGQILQSSTEEILKGIRMSKLATMNSFVTVAEIILTETFFLVTDQVNQYNKTLKYDHSFGLIKCTECTNMQDSTYTNTTWCVIVKRSHTKHTYIYATSKSDHKGHNYDTSSIDLHQGFTSTERLVGANVVPASITDSCYFNPLYKEFYFLKLCGYIVWSIFSFLLWASTGDLSQGVFHQSKSS